MANDFGVVTGDVAGMSAGLSFTASTTPTATQAQAIIDENAAYVAAILHAQGVTASSLSATSQGYLIGRKLTRHLSAVELAPAQHHMLEQVEAWRTTAIALERQIRDYPSTLGASRSTSADAPDKIQTPADYATEIDDNVATADDLSRGLARGGWI